LAVSFITPDMESHFRLIEKRQGQRVAREQVPGFEVSDEQKAVPQVGEDDTPAPKGFDPNGGIKGKRKSKKDKLREAAAKSGGQ
jgi:hypothetical protein